MKLRVFDSPQEWEAAAVQAILDGLEQAASRQIRSRPLQICLSGGSTPAPVYARLALSHRFRELAARYGIEAWVGDEREAAESSGLRNSEMIAHALADALSLPGIVFHPWPVGPRETASHHYAELLTARLGAAPRFDVVLLGMGEDGHTAGFFTMEQIEASRNVITLCTDAPTEPVRRMTCSISLLISSPCVILIIRGKRKLRFIQMPARTLLPYPIGVALMPRTEVIACSEP